MAGGKQEQAIEQEEGPAHGPEDGVPAERDQATADDGRSAPDGGEAASPPQRPVPPQTEEATAGGGEDAQELEEEMDELVSLAAERDEYLALAQRVQADFENYKKRVAREAGVALKRGVVALAKELLPAIDNLERAVAQAESRAEGDPFVAGVKLVHQELMAALERVGVTPFAPLGERFDPTRQEAMAQREAQEGEEQGTVVEVYQPGYRLEDQIIRPARVVVAA